MNGVKITRRGWTVLALTIVALSILVNMVVGTRSVVCDWRSGPTTCSIEEVGR